MPGPYSPDHRVGIDGPPFTDPHPSHPTPGPNPSVVPPAGQAGEAAPPSAAYPGLLPPPVRYPRRRRRRVVLAAMAALVLVAALIAAIGHGVRSGPTTSAGVISDATAKTGIPRYLGA